MGEERERETERERKGGEAGWPTEGGTECSQMHGAPFTPLIAHRHRPTDTHTHTHTHTPRHTDIQTCSQQPALRHWERREKSAEEDKANTLE